MGNTVLVLACRLLGHRPVFETEGARLRWRCARDCGAGATRAYGGAEEARRYAAALNREGRDTLGKRPLLSLLPLRLARRGR
ncbi:MAG TPA: hypothetical protein VKS25_14950 [Solirubrobacteraceae bacterium]|nr:hypothetical protein [Solirubrobacteraceae bacterium]